MLCLSWANRYSKFKATRLLQIKKLFHWRWKIENITTENALKTLFAYKYGKSTHLECHIQAFVLCAHFTEDSKSPTTAFIAFLLGNNQTAGESAWRPVHDCVGGRNAMWCGTSLQLKHACEWLSCDDVWWCNSIGVHTYTNKLLPWRQLLNANAYYFAILQCWGLSWK